MANVKISGHGTDRTGSSADDDLIATETNAGVSHNMELGAAVRERLDEAFDYDASSSDLTLSLGKITVVSGKHFYYVDTQASAATDDLNTILGGTDGQIIIIMPKSGARTVVIKNGTGNIIANADYSLDDLYDAAVLVKVTSGDWVWLGHAVMATGAITARDDDLDLSGGSDGDVLTVQADGSAAFETPTAATVTVDQYDVVARIDAGSGSAGGLASGDLTEEAAPAAGDFLLGWESGGALRIFDLANVLGAGVWTEASAAGPAALVLAEDTDNGSNTVTIDAPNAITTSRRHEIPEGDADDTVALLDSVQTIGGKLAKVVSRSDAGTAITTADSGAWINIVGAATIPNAQGFNCTMEFGGDYDLTFDGNTWNTGSADGDVVSVMVTADGSGTGEIRITPIVLAATVITESDFV